MPDAYLNNSKRNYSVQCPLIAPVAVKQLPNSANLTNLGMQHIA